MRIAEKYNIPHTSREDIFRKNIQGADAGRVKGKILYRQGQVVPDEVVVEIVALRLKESDAANGYLLDGFPRTIAQAEALDKITSIDTVINIDVDLGALSERLTGRRVCSKCGESYHISTKKDGDCEKCGGTLMHRDDDKPETVNNRLAVYSTSTKPLIEYYENQGKLVSVNGMQKIEDVFAEISEALTK